MPSSTSSSDPGPPPERVVPTAPWDRIAVVTVVLFLAALGGWEAYWRGQGFYPSYRNSEGLWAMTRRQVDRAEPGATVIIGSSRALFDTDLEAWEEETGILPIQLALEGTNPRPVLAGLARDPDFIGLLVVGVTPPLFFMPGIGYREGAIERYESETPSQWLSQRISMPLEQILAFYSFDTKLFTVLKRQTWWPERAGVRIERDVRKLANLRRTRQAPLWEKLEYDPAYAALARDIWREFLDNPPPPPPPDEAKKIFDTMIEELQRDVETIRARGGEVVFVRYPSTGHFLEVETRAFPRERFFDVVVDSVDAVGVHFDDHPELQDVTIPEWSHISSRDSPRFTRALIQVLRREFAARGIHRPELGP
jgi:hypothetical protein